MKTRNQLRNNIGGNIRKIREFRNYTQKYTADCMKLSVTAYGDIERGKSGISQSRLEVLARVLEVPYTLLVNFDAESLIGRMTAGAGITSPDGQPGGGLQHALDNLRREVAQIACRQEELLKIMMGKLYMSLGLLLQDIPAQVEISLTGLMELM